MDYTELGQTGMKVSRVCLGTMTWGRQNTPEDAFQQMDYALDLGITFFDTAELYSVPPQAETYGKTEEIIGEWLTKRGARDKIVLASKIACKNAIGRNPSVDYMRDGDMRLDKANITAAVDASLKRLKTDYLDLYQIHWPERAANFFGHLGYTWHDDTDATPLEETLDALADVVKAGKVRAVGLSNDTPWGVMKAVALAEQKGLPRVASVQNPYSLLNRTYEIGLAEISMREQCGLLAYSPLAFGALSGKYLGGARPEGARITLFPYFSRYIGEKGEEATRRYVELAQAHGLKAAQMALAFVMNQPFVTATIIGATTMDQLKDNIAAFDLALSDDVLEGIEAIHKDITNPSP